MIPTLLPTDFLAIAPELALLAGVLLLLGMTMYRVNRTYWFEFVALLTVIAALATTLLDFAPGFAFTGALQVNPFNLLITRIFLLAGFLTIAVSHEYLDSLGQGSGEYYILLLFSLLGMGLMVKAADLLLLIIGLETMSLSIYVLVGLFRSSPKANESAIKYYLMGAVATGVTLFGVAFVFGACDTTSLPAIGAIGPGLKGNQALFLTFGLGLIFVGLAFKVAAFPFQMWVPDVYEGALTTITGFMSTGVKAAAFAALLNVFYNYTSLLSARWEPVLWVVAVGTMTYGNVLAIAQTNIKRMLAFSSIAHAGYLLVAVTALAAGGDATTVSALVYYLTVYLFMNIGAFAIVAALRKGANEFLHLDEYRGLARTHPWPALALTIILFSLAGIPITGGFLVKFYVFSAAINAKLIGLAIIGVLNSAISVYYYLRVTVYMYMRTDDADLVTEKVPSTVSAVVLACLLMILLMGLMPSWFIPLGSYIAAVP